MRPKGTSAELEQRRRHAVAMMRRGMKPAAVAKALRVSLVSVGRWRKTARDGGAEALAAKPARPAAEAEPCPAATTAANARTRSDASRLRHRAVDAGPGRRGDLPPLGRELSPEPGVANSGRVGLELSEAAMPCPRAGRSEGRPLAAGGLAAHKKTRPNPAKACCFSTRRA